MSSAAASQPAKQPAPDRARLVLLRHGESEWNRDKRFTGWTDVGLSDHGRTEARRAGERLRSLGHTFDLCFTSVLRRAIETSEIVLETMDLAHVPIERSWRLNERHYGALQGLDLWRAVRHHGLLSVLRCQYRFASRPPALAPADARFPGHDPRYGALRADELPLGESHADTLARVLPYWREHIAPHGAGGHRVLIVSHKNTLRALLKLLEERTEADVRRLRVPTGVPIVFDYDAQAASGWRRARD